MTCEQLAGKVWLIQWLQDWGPTRSVRVSFWRTQRTTVSNAVDSVTAETDPAGQWAAAGRRRISTNPIRRPHYDLSVGVFAQCIFPIVGSDESQSLRRWDGQWDGQTTRRRQTDRLRQIALMGGPGLRSTCSDCCRSHDQWLLRLGEKRHALALDSQVRK